MSKILQFARAILKRSPLAVTTLVLLVVMGTLPIGTPTASAEANAPATGAPTITGTIQASETLAADTSGISDGDGLVNVTFLYQWISNDGTTDSNIPNATDSTYWFRVVCRHGISRGVKMPVCKDQKQLRRSSLS